MKRLLGLAVVALCSTGAAEAYANCAQPVGYFIQLEGRNVTVCPENFDSRGCGDAEGLVREEIDEGAVVRVADVCIDRPGDTGDGARCYVDECVPAGRYRYGFANPYECQSSSCGTYYYEEIVVTGTEACTRTDPREPSAATGVPWGSDPEICGYGADPGDCATAPLAGGGTGLVFGAQALALLAGLALWLRRRTVRER